MAYLLDTNILLRFVDTSDLQHTQVTAAVRKLEKDEETIYLSPQSLVEAYAVATRPTTARSGLGKTPQQGIAMVRALKATFPMLPDDPAAFSHWLAQVESFGVSGVQTHDCRIVAFMRAHGVTNLLTLNGKDFLRYASLGIVVKSPGEVVAEGEDTPEALATRAREGGTS